MAIDFFYPEYEVVRNPDRGASPAGSASGNAPTRCTIMMKNWASCSADESQMRQLPPLRSPLPHPRAENRQNRPHLQETMPTGAAQAISEIYRQAESGGVLLSSMGNPRPIPCTGTKCSSTPPR